MSKAIRRCSVLRDGLGMTGTKFGCGKALCGACAVHLDGVAIPSCVTPVGSPTMWR
jgi:isoquinoline 1-oxidoreductase subunit alpha